MKKYTLTLLLTAAPLFAGTPAPVAPAPQYNSEQGFTLGLEPMALRPFQSSGNYDKSDYDFGYRGSLGYQFNDGLFLKATYFGYNTDTLDNSPSLLTHESAHMSVSYLDFVVGQTFKPTETFKLSPSIGLRWATFNEGYSRTTTGSGFTAVTQVPVTTYSHIRNAFSGLGLVAGLDATRMLANNFSLYGTLKESAVFGNCDASNTPTSSNSYSSSTDRVLFISEMGLGVQYDFCFSNVTSNIRLGVEGQWWAGQSSNSSENTGLAGFVLGANFRF